MPRRGLEAARPELGDRAAAADDVRGALLDARELGQHLLVGGVPVGDEEPGEEPQDRGDRGGAPRSERPQPGQLPAGRPNDQHVRGPVVRLPRARVLISGAHVDRGLVRPERRLGGQRGLHRVIEPGVLQPAVQPAGCLIHEPGGHRDAEQHADQVRGPFSGHVPVPAQQHRGGVDARAVANRARVRAWRGVRDRHLPAARADQRGQQPLGHEPGDGHVPDLRPALLRGFGAIQPGPAPRALHRRFRALPLIRVRIPGQARPGMAGLPAALAVLAPFPLRFLPLPPPGLAPLLGPDGLFRRRRPGVAAVLPEPAFQVRDSQLQPPLPFQRRRQLRPQHRVLGVLRLDYGPAAGPAAHAAPRPLRADQAHQAQAPIMLNLSQGFNHQASRRVAAVSAVCPSGHENLAAGRREAGRVAIAGATRSAARRTATGHGRPVAATWLSAPATLGL